MTAPIIRQTVFVNSRCPMGAYIKGLKIGTVWSIRKWNHNAWRLVIEPKEGRTG